MHSVKKIRDVYYKNQTNSLLVLSINRYCETGIILYNIMEMHFLLDPLNNWCSQPKPLKRGVECTQQ